MIDINSLMQNPYFLMGLNMMAANRGTGMAPGAAFGQAGLNTMGQLTALEAASANRSYKNKMLEMEAERNRLAAETLKEKIRANKAAEKPAVWNPANKETGEPGNWSGPGGSVTQKKTMDIFEKMIAERYGMLDPTKPPPSPGGSANDWKDLTRRQAATAFGMPQPSPSPTQEPAGAPQPAGSPSRDYRGIIEFNPGEMARQRAQLELERARLLEQMRTPQLRPSPTPLMLP